MKLGGNDKILQIKYVNKREHNVNLADKEFRGNRGRNMEILATNTKILTIWQYGRVRPVWRGYTGAHTHNYVLD